MTTFHRELRVTSDGSSTIFVPSWDEHYHSIHGALQESMHVFIKQGLESCSDCETIRILEVGMGTGLNVLLTALHLAPNQKAVYSALEAFPVEPALWKQLNYTTHLPDPAAEWFEKLHEMPWNTPFQLTEQLKLEKIAEKLEEWEPTPASIDLVYFDAFAPSAQPELWTMAVFEKIYNAMAKKGILVTYCAKGTVKRAMKAVGFQVQALPGPPRKREMTRAVK